MFYKVNPNNNTPDMTPAKAIAELKQGLKN